MDFEKPTIPVTQVSNRTFLSGSFQTHICDPREHMGLTFPSAHFVPASTSPGSGKSSPKYTWVPRHRIRPPSCRGIFVSMETALVPMTGRLAPPWHWIFPHLASLERQEQTVLKEGKCGSSPEGSGRLEGVAWSGHGPPVPHRALGKGALGIFATVAIRVACGVDPLKADPGGGFSTWNRSKAALLPLASVWGSFLWTALVVLSVKNLPADQETRVWPLG